MELTFRPAQLNRLATSSVAVRFRRRPELLILRECLADIVSLQFDSCWRPEDAQIARPVSFDGGTTYSTTLREYNAANTVDLGPQINETISLTGFNTTAADSVRFRFGMVNSGNDWWWAIDNISVSATAIPEPSTASVLGFGAVAFVLARRRRS